MKQHLASWLRRSGLIYGTDKLRFHLSHVKAYGRNKRFLNAHKKEAFPTPYMIYETFKMDYERYYHSGKDTASWLLSSLLPLLPAGNKTFLDWGCGPGRVIRHMPTLSNGEVTMTGCDYNEEYVQWCSTHLEGISFFKNDLHPPLALPDKQFDAVYALSIFTHLSKESHYEWMAEIMRVLKSGGVFLFTTHGDITLENLLPEEIATFNAGQLVVRDQVKEGHRMYATYHPTSFIKELVAPFGTVVQHQPGTRQSWGLQQDTWIVRKG